MIPKVIHTCWFGKNEKPDLIKMCEESVHRNCPDFEIKEWNEDNWDINKYRYAKDAYEQGKWAFVADCARIDILQQYGGITLDSDIEVIKQFSDDLLLNRGFTSRESSGRWISAVIASDINHAWIRQILKYYKTNPFEYNPAKITNTVIIDDINQSLYSHTENNIIYLRKNVAIYPREYFEAKNWSNGKIDVTSNTYTIHHYTGSWL